MLALFTALLELLSLPFLDGVTLLLIDPITVADDGDGSFLVVPFSLPLPILLAVDVVDRLSCSSTFARLEGEVTISISDDGDDDAAMDKSTTAALDAVKLSAAGRFFLDVKPNADKAFVVDDIPLFLLDDLLVPPPPVLRRLVLLVDDDPLPPLALGGELDMIGLYSGTNQRRATTTNYT